MREGVRARESDQHRARIRARIRKTKVTETHAIVTQVEPEAPCTYTYQFILDNGVEERLWQLKEGDADQIQDLLGSSDDMSYDLERNRRIFKGIHEAV